MPIEETPERSRQDQITRINKLKTGLNALVVAHYYQFDDVQAIADFVGDSFALARVCTESPASVIVFCGVHFMAESAKILSPQKTVLLPERNAGCPMADMVDDVSLRAWKKDHPGVPVVCYINSSAAVKAESTICCTSSNAVAVVRALPESDILFVPDCNLGQYVAKQVPDKKIHFWEGFCWTHHRVKAEDVLTARKARPDALLLVHPECKPEVWQQADFIGSTKQIIDYAKNSAASEFLIGTEMGVLWQLRKDNPGKQFYLLSSGMICPNMKKTTLDSIEQALSNIRYKIDVPFETAEKARIALSRMLEIS